jgi:hypothetical protein
MYFISGCLLFIASLLDYPLASMFAWALLAICFLNLQLFSNQKVKKRFFYYGAISVILMMIAYFIIIKLVHQYYHVNLKFGRSALIDTSNLMSRFVSAHQSLVLNTRLWLIDPDRLDSSYFCSLLICLLLTIATIRISLQNGSKSILTIGKNIIIITSVSLVLYILSYSPALAQSINFTFRYSLVTMPFVLYIILWSTHTLFYRLHPENHFISRSATILRTVILVFITCFGIVDSNFMLADGIAGPHQHDFEIIQKQLSEKAIPLLRQNKRIVIHLVDCDGVSNYKYGRDISQVLEYGMRICQFRNHAMEAVSRSLMTFGYISNFHSVIKTQIDPSKYIVDAPWGLMVLNNDRDSLSFTTNYPTVTIDLRNSPPYNRFDFYKKFFNTHL